MSDSGPSGSEGPAQTAPKEEAGTTSSLDRNPGSEAQPDAQTQAAPGEKEASARGASAAEEIEGLDERGAPWGDYPIDSLLIRHEHRTVHDVVRRIDRGTYVLNPDFQREFLWDVATQSKLIESIVMRIPLPVLYLAENDDGKVVVVDGLQRLRTFQRFLANELRLRLPDRPDLNGKRFSDLSEKLQNRVEDCSLTLYSIDSKVPERARLDIFDRVNSGVALTRQQMRNCLYMGPATRFLADEAGTDLFKRATGGSLKHKTMRDREFVNRFCAFHLLPIEEYDGDMDRFLARALGHMNRADDGTLHELREAFRRTLTNNHMLFQKQAFRKHEPDQDRRGIINASLWDVMSTGLAPYEVMHLLERAETFRDAFFDLLRDEQFNEAITYGPNDARKVRRRFRMARRIFQETLDADPD
ncbi:MAG: DUF262 domain-containing protein [Acidobacteriota bacterium]|nr:DUF262 domain-containing protein [Acidobacteriota bacterium]